MTSIDQLLNELEAQIHEARLGLWPIRRAWIEELRSKLGLLEYIAASSREGWTRNQQQPLGDPACSAPGCGVSWRDHDACLLRSEDTWLCREHYSMEGRLGLPPPGWQPPAAQRDATEAATRVALKKLERNERPLVNRNLV